MRHPYAPARNQRLDRFLYKASGQPVFFTVRSYRQSQPFVNPELARAVSNCLLEERSKHGIDVYVYCLLPDHLHLVACPQEDGKDTLTFLDRFKGRSTKISWDHGCPGKLWQPRSFDHLVRKEESLLDIAKYILENPVRRGLADRWEDYPGCGLVDPMPLG